MPVIKPVLNSNKDLADELMRWKLLILADFVPDTLSKYNI